MLAFVDAIVEGVDVGEEVWRNKNVPKNVPEKNVPEKNVPKRKNVPEHKSAGPNPAVIQDLYRSWWSTDVIG